LIQSARRSPPDRRKRSFWRVAAAWWADRRSGRDRGDRVGWTQSIRKPSARSRASILEGLIRSDHDRSRHWSGWKSPAAAAVIVHINSPGGTTAGSEQLYDSLVRLKAKKPLVSWSKGLAASGGYITAIAADHIIAQQSSLVGSIGVLFQFPNFHRASENGRRQGRGSEVLAAEGSAPTALSRPARKRARRWMRWSGFLRLVPRPREAARGMD
jgi:hypothetical protein